MNPGGQLFEERFCLDRCRWTRKEIFASSFREYYLYGFVMMIIEGK